MTDRVTMGQLTSGTITRSSLTEGFKFITSRVPEAHPYGLNSRGVVTEYS